MVTTGYLKREHFWWITCISLFERIINRMKHQGDICAKKDINNLSWLYIMTNNCVWLHALL